MGDETVDPNLSDELIRGTDGKMEPLDPSELDIESTLETLIGLGFQVVSAQLQRSFFVPGRASLL